MWFVVWLGVVGLPAECAVLAFLHRSSDWMVFALIALFWAITAVLWWRLRIEESR